METKEGINKVLALTCNLSFYFTCFNLIKSSCQQVKPPWETNQTSHSHTCPTIFTLTRIKTVSLCVTILSFQQPLQNSILGFLTSAECLISKTTLSIPCSVSRVMTPVHVRFHII